MNSHEARVIPLDEFRRRRQERRMLLSGPVVPVVWYPVWIWVPIWRIA